MAREGDDFTTASKLVTDVPPSPYALLDACLLQPISLFVHNLQHHRNYWYQTTIF